MKSRYSTASPQTQQSIHFLTPFETDDLHEKAGEDKGHWPDPESWLACPRFGSSNSSCLLDATNPTSTRNILHHTTNNPNSPIPIPSKNHTSKAKLPNIRTNSTQTNTTHTPHIPAAMDQAKEFLEMPREFVKDGRQFITRCSKRTPQISLFFPTHRERV
jgi:hypothetical protein